MIVVATFRAGTPTAGQTIEHDNGVFTLSGAPLTARQVLAYDELEQIDWASPSYREFVSSRVVTPASPPQVTPVQSAPVQSTTFSPVDSPTLAPKADGAKETRVFKGVTCKVELNESEITLHHESADRPWHIPLDSVSGVHYLPRKTILREGYVRILLNGADQPKVNLAHALADPATVEFTGGRQLKPFAELASLLQARIAANRAMGIDPARVPVEPPPSVGRRMGQVREHTTRPIVPGASSVASPSKVSGADWSSMGAQWSSGPPVAHPATPPSGLASHLGPTMPPNLRHEIMWGVFYGMLMYTVVLILVAAVMMIILVSILKPST